MFDLLIMLLHKINHHIRHQTSMMRLDYMT
jgi:hypothetical protein